MGISKLLSDATSYWPAWLENSWLILSRTSFSGRTVKFTPMPVCLVKFAAVSRCRSIICGLLTISTLMLLAPPAPVFWPPHPAHPVVRAATSRAAAVADTAARTRARDMRPPRRGGHQYRYGSNRQHSGHQYMPVIDSMSTAGHRTLHK